MRKKIIIIGAVLAVILIGGYFLFFTRNGKEQYKTATVSFGEVIREVSETGAVKVSEKINIGFKYSGKIKKIGVAVGDKVLSGQELAELDTSELYIKLSEARAALEAAEADYQKLLAGSSVEEIRVAEAEAYNAQVSLSNAEQNLEDVEIGAAEDLNQAYKNALDTLDDAYLKAYNAQNAVESIRRTYFSSSDQESTKVKENEAIIENSLVQIGLNVSLAQDGSDQDIETALSKTKEELADIKKALEIIREITEAIKYRDVVSDADKTILDNQKLYIITIRSDVVSDEQTISTVKITNKTNINAAKASVASAQAALQKARDQLELKKAGPVQEDINLYLAKIKQAEANVSLLNNKIAESVLRAPLPGQIIEINKKKGETVQPTDYVFSFLPSGDFQVEADIYEEDIVDIKEGDPVKINLPAFPDEELTGKVVSVNPAEKLIDGVVYYEVNIIFEEIREGIKPGMTADIVIETNRKENVLVIPREALEKRNGIKIVKVLYGNQIENREIKTGLEGDNYVEIISGLSKGEQVIID